MDVWGLTVGKGCRNHGNMNQPVSTSLSQGLEEDALSRKCGPPDPTCRDP